MNYEESGYYRTENVPADAMVVTARQIAEIVEANGYILAQPMRKKDFEL